MSNPNSNHHSNANPDPDPNPHQHYSWLQVARRAIVRATLDSLTAAIAQWMMVVAEGKDDTTSLRRPTTVPSPDPSLDHSPASSLEHDSTSKHALPLTFL